MGRQEKQKGDKQSSSPWEKTIEQGLREISKAEAKPDWRQEQQGDKKGWRETRGWRETGKAGGKQNKAEERQPEQTRKTLQQ